MAENYDVTGVLPGQELVNGTQLKSTIELVAVTKPHGIVFSVTVDKVAGWRSAIEAAAAQEAAELESAFDL